MCIRDRTTPEGKIYKELAADHFADPKGLGKYALFLRPSQGDLIPAPQMEPSLLLSGRYRPITLEGRNLFATRDFYAFFKHLEETGIEATHKGVVVIAMNKLREVMLEDVYKRQPVFPVPFRPVIWVRAWARLPISWRTKASELWTRSGWL